jgi:dimethylargininase
MAECELTWIQREPVNHDRALLQHEDYRRTLHDCGARVVVLDVNPGLPDSVFVEDTAIVLPEVAVITSMGAESRRAELPAMAFELSRYRSLEQIHLPARIDGGDVVVTGRDIFVGVSSRTDRAGIDALGSITAPFGYTVTPVRVTGCLHLKSACTALPDGRLLVNPGWIEMSDLGGRKHLAISDDEPFAGDVALVGDTVVAGASFPRTNSKLRESGMQVREVDLSEFAKAEGGVTCLSLIFETAD